VAELRDIISAAVKRRADLFPRVRDAASGGGMGDEGGTEIWRAVSGEFDGLRGVFADVYGVGAVMNVYEGQVAPGFDVNLAAEAVLEGFSDFGVRAVYVKPFVRDRSRLGGDLPAEATAHTPAAGTAVAEDPSTTVVLRELSWKLEIRLTDGLSTGVFVDQRENRRWVYEQCARRPLRVLNTFAYTCAFSVAAATGGAAEVTSVDVSGKYLDWGKRNFEVNSLDPADPRFRWARMDTFEFLGYAKRKGLMYDLIILDPPSFGSGNKRKGIRPWSAVADYARLVREACGLAARGATILASTNNAELCRGNGARLEKEIVAGVGRKPRWSELPEPGADIRAEHGRVAWRAFVV
jgi:23S rRNA (cytosine1962-C5)-methyltransferase